MKEKFATIGDAEEAYGINYFSEKEEPIVCQDATASPSDQSRPLVSARTPLLGFSPLRDNDLSRLPGCVLEIISTGFSKLTKRQREQLLVHLFHKWLTIDIHAVLGNYFVPREFLPLLANAMTTL